MHFLDVYRQNEVTDLSHQHENIHGMLNASAMSLLGCSCLPTEVNSLITYVRSALCPIMCHFHMLVNFLPVHLLS